MVHERAAGEAVAPAPLVPWAAAPIPAPPRSERDRPRTAADPVGAGLALLDAHAAVVSVLVGRSPADFRPVPSWVAEREAEVRAAFAPSGALPPSLVAELAPLVAPRLERVVEHLRQRLGRERELLALPRLREMDPACVRRNARLPGRTLIEKAGPHQEVYGVRRVPRFDTMENRVLVATSGLLRARAGQELRRPHPAGDPRAQGLRRLVRACEAVLARPELEGLTAPRPGERPSNALRGDPNYRAIWRAGQLLRREEERFVAEWEALPDTWVELVLLAAWAAMAAEGEPVPTWVRVADGRQEGLRIETGAPRRWIAEHGEQAVVTTIEPDRLGGCVHVRRQVSTPTSSREETWRVPAALWIGDRAEEGGVLGAVDAAPGLERARALVGAALGGWGLGSLPAVASEGAPATAKPGPVGVAAPFLGISALDAHLILADARGARDAGPAAVALVEVPGEATMVALGRSATWLPEVWGPSAILGAHAEAGGALFAAFRGGRDTAVVVPDTLDELGVRRLRARCGRAWFVWSPVAAALTAAAEHADSFGVEPTPRTVLFVIATDAALDVAVLEETTDPGQPARAGRPARPGKPGRLWVRSAPLGGEAEGREGGRFPDAGVRGAWLRTPEATAGWALDAAGARHLEIPAPVPVVERALVRAARWKGAPPTLLVTTGLTEAEGRTLQAGLGLPALHLDPAALARGAAHFLERHHAGLATWKDRLPELTFEVVHHRLQVPVTLIQRDTLVAPGDVVDFSPPMAFFLRDGAPSVRFRIARERRPAACAIVLEGAAFPLKQPVEVRLRLRYTYGLQGMEGAVEPVRSAPFARVPFRIDVADGAEDRGGRAGEPRTNDGGAAAPTRPPSRRKREPLGANAEQSLRAAVQALEEATRSKVAKEAIQQPGKADKQLLPLVREVAGAAKVQAGSVPTQGALRAYLEEKAAPLLDWLLGFGWKGRGKPPLLGREASHLVVQARAELVVPGTGEFWKKVQAEIAAGDGFWVPMTNALHAMGRIVDGDPVRFAALVAFSPSDSGLWGAWAAALRDALDAHPDLAASIDAAALLDRVIQALEDLAALSTVERWKDAVRNLSDLIPRLCHSRPDQLDRDSEPVFEAIDRLSRLRETLPAAVRSHGGRRSTQAESEPIAVAIAYLEANYDQLPELR